MRLVAFCEAPADFRIVVDLVDRVLREVCPDWVGDVMDVDAGEIRSWRSDGDQRDFFVLRRLSKYEERLSVNVPHGHFDGRPGGHSAMRARTVFQVVRALAKGDAPIDAVLLITDMDNEPVARRDGTMQARTEAQRWATFKIVLGLPNAMREAWVLGGFEPDGDDEESRLAVLRRELGFHPHIEAHLLDSNDETAKKSPKRVLRALTLDDRDREERCWKATPLATLRERGESSGLREFLVEIATHLAPLVTRAD